MSNNLSKKIAHLTTISLDIEIIVLIKSFNMIMIVMVKKIIREIEVKSLRRSGMQRKLATFFQGNAI